MGIASKCRWEVRVDGKLGMHAAVRLGMGVSARGAVSRIANSLDALLQHRLDCLNGLFLSGRGSFYWR
ncbi:MAG: hypothetical protein EB084_15870 [Proteobacteria bacterium]|nr:hypothetical protein [Pseudomonadota bacterium]